MGRGRGALIPGVFLVLLGLYFLAPQVGIHLPGLEVLWPGIPVIVGLLSLGQYAFGGRFDSGLIFSGLAAGLTGVFFFLFTLHVPVPLPGLGDGVDWPDMGRLWPAFVVIAGLAFLGQWLVSPAHRGARNLSLLALVFGLAALVVNYSLTSTVLERVINYWPVLLIALGLWFLLQHSRRGPTGA
jgi:hypothetical protein